MAYDKEFLERWFETRAEVFVQKSGKGLIRQSIDVDEVRREFRLIAAEFGMMLESQQVSAMRY